MGKTQSKQLDEIILNIYKVLESNCEKDRFDPEEVLIYTRQMSKFRGKSMKCNFLDEKYINPKIYDGFLILFYSSVRLNDDIDIKAKEKFDKTFPDLDIRKKACFIYFLESIENIFDDICDFNDISIRNLCFKYSSTFIGKKVGGKCYDFYTKYGVKSYD